jgi:hypothetical protein
MTKEMAPFKNLSLKNCECISHKTAHCFWDNLSMNNYYRRINFMSQFYTFVHTVIAFDCISVHLHVRQLLLALSIAWLGINLS